MAHQQSGPGMVSLDGFVSARLHEDQELGRRSPTEVLAVQRIIAAHRAATSPVHRAGIGVALKALAGVWAQHPDYDPTWRL
jgi:hypothetical protein